MSRFFDTTGAYGWRIELRDDGSVWQVKSADGQDCEPFLIGITSDNIDSMLSKGDIVEVHASAGHDIPQTVTEVVW